MRKNYIIPKTQVKTVSTEMPIAESVTIDSSKTAGDNEGGHAKKGFSIWDEN